MIEENFDAMVLIVDDDELHATAVSQQLVNNGYRARMAFDAVTALARIDAEPPDLILLDVNMPGVDGVEFCRYLKSIPEASTIPTVMVTGLGTDETRSRANDAGADDFLTKPLDVDQLFETIARHLDASRVNDLELAVSGANNIGS